MTSCRCHQAARHLWLQEGGFLASLGMQCQTGSCIYNTTSPPPGDYTAAAATPGFSLASTSANQPSTNLRRLVPI